MNYQEFYKILLSIINHPLTHTLLIALVTVGVAWFAQSQERKKWEIQRKEERQLWIYDKELQNIEYELKTYDYILSGLDELEISFKPVETSNNFFSNFMLRLPIELQNIYSSLLDNNELASRKKYNLMIDAIMKGYLELIYKRKKILIYIQELT